MAMKHVENDIILKTFWGHLYSYFAVQQTFLLVNCKIAGNQRWLHSWKRKNSYKCDYLFVSKKSPCKPNLSYFSNAVSIVYISLCMFCRFFFIYSIPHLSVCPILYWIGFKNISKILIAFSSLFSFTHIIICRVFVLDLKLTFFLHCSLIGKKWATSSLPQHLLQLCMYSFFFDASFVFLSLIMWK